MSRNREEIPSSAELTALAVLERIEEESLDLWDAALATEAGRQIIWSVLEKGAMFQRTHTGNSDGAFFEGRRSVATDIYALYVERDMETYHLMRREHAKRVENARIQIESEIDR